MYEFLANSLVLSYLAGSIVCHRASLPELKCAGLGGSTPVFVTDAGAALMSEGRILVVDDEPQIRRIMRTTLVNEGYEVTDARSGEEALELFQADRYDLVILDMNM